MSNEELPTQLSRSESQSDPELSQDSIAINTAIKTVISELPRYNSEHPQGSPAIELPNMNPEDVDEPLVVFIREKYVQFIGFDNEARKSVSFYHIPHYVIGRNGDSLLLAAAQVNPYESEAVHGISDDPRDVLLPKPDTEQIICELNPTMIDRLRNLPVQRRRKKLAQRALDSTTDTSGISTQSESELKVYGGRTLEASSGLRYVHGGVTDEIATGYHVSETLAKLVRTYKLNDDEK